MESINWLIAIANIRKVPINNIKRNNNKRYLYSTFKNKSLKSALTVNNKEVK